MEVAVSILASLAASGALTAALVFLSKTWISERVKNAIKHEYDQKLETFRANIRADQAIKDAAAASFSATHSAAFERRLDAIRTIWQAIMRMRQNTPAILQITDHLSGERYAQFIETTRDNQQVRDQVRFETLGETFAPILKDADDVRPFAGEYLFALFDAYRSLIILAASILHTNLENGSGKSWHETNHLDYLFESFMTKAEFEDFHGQLFKLEWARKCIEHKMIEHISVIISGQESGDLALSQAKKIEEAALKAQLDARQKAT